MIATAYAPALTGMNGQLVTIECDVTNGLPGLTIVGLGDKAVEEARERLRSAIKNSGFSLPPKRITLNLAPADLPKDGSGYDLGMAMAILGASGQLDVSVLKSSLLLGELALNGSINSTRGSVIAAQLAATTDQFERVFVPRANADNASLIDSIKVFGVGSLIEIYNHFLGQTPLSIHVSKSKTRTKEQPPLVDLQTVYGQVQAKRAVEIAAAGGHNILLSGPPGTGKTLLAKSIIGLLPPPSAKEIIEITSLHSLVSAASIDLITARPFRAPHHTASDIALIGGGSRPRPGEISLSHAGVLFMDELPEFPRSVLEVLRQPLEDGVITVARAAGSLTFPARFMLVATSNPCPCGFFGAGGQNCRCTPGAIDRYRTKVSGPLLDRIDLVVEVGSIDHSEIVDAKPAESSKQVALRVSRARDLQYQRLSNHTANINAHLSNTEINKYCKLDNETRQIARIAVQELELSTRGYMRTLKVARTIADLNDSDAIKCEHFSEALLYRPRVFQAKKPTNTPILPIVGSGYK